LGIQIAQNRQERLHLPGADSIDRIYAATDRNVRVLTNLQRMFGHGRLSARLSLHPPVDQGIRAFRRRSFAKNPDYLTAQHRQARHRRRLQRRRFHFRVLGSVAALYAHKFPHRQMNHNELLHLPQ